MFAHALRVLLLAVVVVLAARAQDNELTVILKGSFTTGSELYPNPNSTDPLERASSFSLEDIPGFGVELRYSLPQINLAFGLSADYLRATVPTTVPNLPVDVPAEDGYRVIPVELTGYFILPFSGQAFSVYMGGGGGAYFGRRIYRIAGVEALPLHEGTGFGIQVLGGVRYRFSEWFSLCAEMKFRDVQFDGTNAFPVAWVDYQGTVVNLSRDLLYSRVHADGVVFQIGTMFGF